MAKKKGFLMWFATLSACLLCAPAIITEGNAVQGLAETTTPILDECKDICDSSWGNNGWTACYYVGNASDTKLFPEVLSTNLPADTQWFMQWMAPRSDASSYQANDTVAIKFLADIPDVGLRVRVDQFLVDVTPNKISLLEYNFDKGEGNFNSSDGEFWSLGAATGWFNEIASKEVFVDDVAQIEFAVKTVDGTTTISAAVEENIVSYETTKARKYSNNVFIDNKTQSLKIYSTQLREYEKSFDQQIAEIDPDIYNSVKEDLDVKVAEAKKSLYSMATLTRSDAISIVDSVEKIVAIYTDIASYTEKCVDVSDAAWGETGWRNGPGAVALSSEYLAYDLIPANTYANQKEMFLYWYDGVAAGKYTENADFGVSFAVDVNSEGVVVKVDQFAARITKDFISIVFAQDNYDQIHYMAWFYDIDILQSWGGTSGGYLSKKDVSLTGIVEVDFYLSTDENGQTLIMLKVEDEILIVNTAKTRRYYNHVYIMNGYENTRIYSTQISNAITQIGESVQLLDETVYEKNKGRIDTLIAKEQETLAKSSDITTATLETAVANMQAMMQGLSVWGEFVMNFTAEAYSEENWALIQEIDEEFYKYYFERNAAESMSFMEVCKERMQAVLTKTEEVTLVNARADAQQEIASLTFDENAYTEKNWAKIQERLAYYSAMVDTETDVQQIALIVKACRIETNSVHTIVGAREYYSALIADVVNALSESDYTQENWATIVALKDAGQAEISNLFEDDEMKAKYEKVCADIFAVEKMEQTEAPVIPEKPTGDSDSAINSDSSDNAKKGCGSVVGSGMLAATLCVVGATMICKRRKDDEGIA